MDEGNELNEGKLNEGNETLLCNTYSIDIKLNKYLIK